MRILILSAIILFTTSCDQGKVHEIELEMVRINQLTDTLHHIEVEEDWNTGRIEDTRIMYLFEKDSSIRRIKSVLRLGTYDLDTLHELDYYYKNDQVLFIRIRETINSAQDTVTVNDCEYYFEDQKLIFTNCLTGESKKGEHLLTAARFNLKTVEQLMENEK